MSAELAPVVVFRHVPWEGPHRIVSAAGLPRLAMIDPLLGQQLPEVERVAAAVVMGGPMNVDDTARHPRLAAERDWIARAIQSSLPLLGVCLGAQLIARALGAGVSRGERPEIGFAPVAIANGGDPVVGALAPSTVVLHWHGDVMELPAGAELLASSEQTEVQAFRHGSAWATLFHAEADSELVDCWLEVPEMREEARAALGGDADSLLRAAAAQHEHPLVERSTPGFEAFARLAAQRARRLAAG